MKDDQIRVALDLHWEASDAGDFETEHSIYSDDAVHVPRKIGTIELDLDVRYAVVADPFSEIFGKAVSDFLADVGRCDRIHRADQMIQRHMGLGLARDITIQKLASKLTAEVSR